MSILDLFSKRASEISEDEPMSEHERAIQFLNDRNIPAPDGLIERIRYSMASNDIHVQVDSKWFLWDERKKTWRFCPQGPLDR